MTHIGVQSVDKFIDTVTDLIERFAVLCDGLEEKRRILNELTGFDKIPKAKKGNLSRNVTGTLL